MAKPELTSIRDKTGARVGVFVKTKGIDRIHCIAALLKFARENGWPSWQIDNDNDLMTLTPL
jgi:hypothetical protein